MVGETEIISVKMSSTVYFIHPGEFHVESKSFYEIKQ